MCGIAGIFGERDDAAVERMISALDHRGPDGLGLHSVNRATLGHRRLAIIDTSDGGRQPMSAADGLVWITYNGEIYNYRLERERLETDGYVFHSNSDTEVILALYLKYGSDFVRRLRGIYAIAILDLRDGPGREKLLLARDPLGVKPLLYAHSGSSLIFASELKAMLASRRVEPVIDPAAVQSLLTWGAVYQPRTILRDVMHLPPGSLLVAAAGSIRVERFWMPSTDRVAGLRGAGYPEIRAEVERTLTEVLRSQLVADVDVGAFLSGGIDSSLLVALMTREHNGRLRTFSVGFGSYAGAIDETDDAAEVAKYLGTEHTRLEVSGDEVRDHIDSIVAALDQPSVDGVNSYFVSKAAGRDVKVAISGTGADEVFAGYPWFAAMTEFAEGRRRGGGGVRALLRQLITRTGGAKANGNQAFLNRYAGQYHIFGAAKATAMMEAGLRRQCPEGFSESHDLARLDILPKGTALERTSALCLGGYTLNQLLRDIDATSMAHGLEVRVPFLDERLVDVALSLPDFAKHDPDITASATESYQASGIKRVLVDIGSSLLPTGFSNRRKRGFAMPFDEWLRGPLHDILQDCLSRNAVISRGLVDPAGAETVLQDFKARRIGWAQPWLMMMLELWCRAAMHPTKVSIP